MKYGYFVFSLSETTLPPTQDFVVFFKKKKSIKPRNPQIRRDMADAQQARASNGRTAECRTYSSESSTIKTRT